MGSRNSSTTRVEPAYFTIATEAFCRFISIYDMW